MKKNRTIIIIISIISLSLILIAIMQATKTEFVNMEPHQDQELLYVGSEKADNELLFMFDYACPWCVIWIDEILPVLESDYIESGELLFRTQAMVYVDQASLRLADFDQKLKEHFPDNYHEIFTHIALEAPIDPDISPDWGTDSYILEIIDTYQLDQDKALAEPKLSSNELSQVYTNALSVDTVPAVYVNGVQVEDPFDLDEIIELIN